MITHQILKDDRITIVEPSGPLSQEDFTSLAKSVDAFIHEHGPLHGLLIHTPGFPGWEDFGALTHHLRFVKDHHRLIRRIALVSDSPLASIAPRIANHFVAAKVDTFAYDDYGKALDWLRSET